ncbi:MAG: carbohydrate kinase family protein [Muribaculaceae bacterium]
MRKIIAIGESVLDTVFKDNVPVKSFVGGRVANAASSLALSGLEVMMVSECGDDHVGNIVIDFLKGNNVNVTSVDRYVNGTTAFSAIFENGRGEVTHVNYGTYPPDRFDVVWPRIDEDDIVIFGSLYSIENPQRSRLYEILQYASSRKAIMVYLPGFQHGINYSITKVMPNVLENFELSNVVIANNSDIHDIFPRENGSQAYRNHMIYCNCLVYITEELNTNVFGHGIQSNVVAPAEGNSSNMLGWQAGHTAGIVFGMVTAGITHKNIGSTDADTWKRIATDAYRFANHCAASPTNCVQPPFALERQKELAQALQELSK